MFQVIEFLNCNNCINFQQSSDTLLCYLTFVIQYSEISLEFYQKQKHTFSPLRGYILRLIILESMYNY